MILGKLTLAAVLVGSICIVGCSGSSDAAEQPNVANKTAAGKNDQAVSGSPKAGINPAYQGSANADNNRVGSSAKGGN